MREAGIVPHIQGRVGKDTGHLEEILLAKKDRDCLAEVEDAPGSVLIRGAHGQHDRDSPPVQPVRDGRQNLRSYAFVEAAAARVDHDETVSWETMGSQRCDPLLLDWFGQSQKQCG